MKIKATPEVMENLQPGDKLFLRGGGRVEVGSAAVNQGIMFPVSIHFKGYAARCFSYDLTGNYDNDLHPLDIVSVEKTIQIPEGFIPWHGGECPVPRDTMVEAILRSGERRQNPAGFYEWGLIPSFTKVEIIAYRVITPKQSGEIWVAVLKTKSVFAFASKNESLSWVRQRKRGCEAFPGRQDVLAIFNPFVTGGKWKEGDGLGLLEGK